MAVTLTPKEKLSYRIIKLVSTDASANIDLTGGAVGHRGRGHLVAHPEEFARLAVGMPGLERGKVGVPNVRLGSELAS